MESEIIQLNVQRPGTSKIGLEAKLIELDDGTCRVALARPVEDIALVGTVAEQDEWMTRHREAFAKRAS